MAINYSSSKLLSDGFNSVFLSPLHICVACVINFCLENFIFLQDSCVLHDFC